MQGGDDGYDGSGFEVAKPVAWAQCSVPSRPAAQTWGTRYAGGGSTRRTPAPMRIHGTGSGAGETSKTVISFDEPSRMVGPHVPVPGET